MTPAKRLATAVLDIAPNPDIRGLAQCYELAHQILRKRPASPAAKYKPQLDTKPARKRWKAAETEKRRIVSAHQEGVNIARIAAIYRVNVVTISKILKERK